MRALFVLVVTANASTIVRELLSRHETKATYVGVKASRVPLRLTSPRQPTKKQWATFTIRKYLSYSKPGQHGDEQQQQFAFIAAQQSDAVRGALAKLTPGEDVLLSWDHEYVTREFKIRYKHATSKEMVECAGPICSAPERIVTKLAPDA